MENKIDQFFKDKLESHSLPPSEEAWTKVEAKLSKKNNVVVWRIAAAILVTGALVSVIIWSQRGADNNQPAIANNSTKKNSIKEKVSPKISSEQNKEEAKSTERKSSVLLHQAEPQKKENKSDQSDKQENETPSTKTEIIENETNEQTVAVVKENIPDGNIKQEATPSTTIASTKKKSIKLEFTLEDFPSEQPVATVNEVKSSGLKKVWDLAREVKNGDRPVRGMKNELFALNFKKNKNQ